MRWLSLLLLLPLYGCQAGYYWHVAHGHTTLMMAREPVAEVMADPATPQALRERLLLSAEVLAFAEQALELPSDGSYRDYVALDQGWVVWNLFAAPEFSLDAHTWCYPVAGCASYRGFFQRQRAEREAERLRAEGFDVYGAGAIAYSTLGWFDDPLTTPMLARSDAAIVRLLIHELVHQRFYLKGDTRFNESLATAVARHGLDMWRVMRGDTVVSPSADPAQEQVHALLRQLRDQLDALYQRELPAAAMREHKQRLQDDTRAAFHQALQSDDRLAPWSAFFDGPLNNAQLNTVAEYHQWVPAFTVLINQCQAHWPCFWQRVEALAELPQVQRDARLESLQNGTESDD